MVNLKRIVSVSFSCGFGTARGGRPWGKSLRKIHAVLLGHRVVGLRSSCSSHSSRSLSPIDTTSNIEFGALVLLFSSVYFRSGPGIRGSTDI